MIACGLVIVLITSGIVIWEQYFSEYFSIMQKRIAALIHSIAAIMAIGLGGREVVDE
ncbi:MAG: hypothetical protein AB7S93_26730 [Xanthobacteraceae bacterium]